jgi:predicted DNA binding protein
MSVIAELSIHSDQFLLGRILSEFPDLTVEIERVVPAEKRVMPYIWGHGTDPDAFVDAMRESPNVKSVAVLDRLDDSALYKIEWEDPTSELISGIAETDATILEAHSAEQWTFRIRFADHTGLREFNRYCADHDITYRLERVTTLGDGSRDGYPYDLTPAQFETLTLAVERGYFKIPRQVTFAVLAEELGVSEQAISERVRRGADTVLSAELIDGPTSLPGQ